jgi:hypothetical protein
MENGSISIIHGYVNVSCVAKLKVSQKTALLNVKVIYATPQYVSTTTAKHLLLIRLKY